jgi:hypothetical protein
VVLTTVAISGLLKFDEPIAPSEERVHIPARLIEVHELVYKMAGDFQDFRAGDLLIVEPREIAASGERVLATFRGKVYIGNWWTKNGKLELVVDPVLKHMRKVKMIGAINCVVRFA